MGTQYRPHRRAYALNCQDDLTGYYQGVSIGVLGTTQLKIPTGTGKLDLGDGRGEIDSALLYDADRLTKAAVASYLASSQVAAGGHFTWAEITMYYARFHTITALLRLAGITPVEGKRLLLRTNELSHGYSVLPRNDPEAQELGFGGGASHLQVWKMFSRNFRDWSDSVMRAATSSLTEEPSDGELQHYRFPTMRRNQANYLQSIAGVFFPETDLTGGQEFTVGTAQTIGHWDWLRTDENPFSYEEPPEADFFEQMMAWDLIKYVIGTLVAIDGHRLIDQYTWIIENLGAFSELREHMVTDLNAIRP